MSSKLLVLMILLSLVATQAFALTQVTPTPMPANIEVIQNSINVISISRDYDNTVNGPLSYLPQFDAGGMVADDVHRTSSDPIGMITFGYYSPNTVVDAILAVYANDSEDKTASLIDYYELTGLPIGAYVIDIGLATPLVAPQDMWIGLVFSDANAGLMVYDPPVVGTSHDIFVIDTNGDGAIDETGYFGGVGGPDDPMANFCIATTPAPVPEPGSLLALGGGLVSLLAFRRRR